jgi:MFS family permease
MPTLSLAVLVLLLRFSISQMDVPTRQSYTMAVVEARERSPAGGFTGVARTTGAAISPLLTGYLQNASAISPRRASLVEKKTVRSDNRTRIRTRSRRATPFRPPLIVPGRVLGVLGAPLVPVNSICYR